MAISQTPTPTRNPNPTDGSQGVNYTAGMPITNTFEFEPGTCVLPIAEEPPTDPTALAAWSPVVVFQLHAAYRLRRTNYEAVKSNNPPVMPSPVSAGAFVFVGGSITMSNTLNSSYTSFDWAAASSYVYVENCVSRVQDGLVLGVPPWVWQTSVFNVAQGAGGGVVGQNQSQPPVGAVGQAGYEVRVAASMGNMVTLNNGTAYMYNMPSFFPGTFFNDYMVNGGTPS